MPLKADLFMKAISKSFALILLVSFSYKKSFAQQDRLDELFQGKDTMAVIDSILADFDFFLDSLSKPRSFFNVSVNAATGIFSFENKNSVEYFNEKRLIVAPALSYFHKTGLGLSGIVYFIQKDGKPSYYQAAISPSYDLIKKNVSAGLAYSHFLQKDSLDFYTTPLQHELFGYFSYKKWFLRPTVGLAYGWGSRESFERQRVRLLRRRLMGSRNLFVTERQAESVSDFSVIVSVRKDFNWYGVFGKNDNVSFTPVAVLNCGTQQYGFNTSYTYRLPSTVRVNALPSNSSVSDNTAFAAQSVALVLRGSYMKGKFLLQPQVFFDYFLPETDKPFNSVFSLMAGMSF